MTKSSLSLEYISIAVPHCFRLFIQLAVCPRLRALFNAGSSIAARMAMIAITTNSSIKVNALLGRGEKLLFTGKEVFPLSPNPTPFFKKSGILCDDKSEPQRSDSSRRSETKTEGRVFPRPAERAGKEVFPPLPKPHFPFQEKRDTFG